MIPLAGVSALWGPLAITIMFGLLFSMVLTLIFIPLRFYKNPGQRYAGLKIESKNKEDKVIYKTTKLYYFLKAFIYVNILSINK
jgi:Cu/Ag efflux pump CusA